MQIGVRCGIVDPRRGNYPDDTESRRYRGGEHQYPDQEGHTWFEGRPEAGFGQPDPRAGRGGQMYGPSPGMTGQIGQPMVEQRPPMHPEAQWDPTSTGTQPAAQSRRGRSASQSSGGGRSIGRPAVALLLTIAVVVAELPAVRLLLASAFGSKLAGGGLVAGLLLVIGLPLGAIGLHGLTGDTARGAGPTAWLRAPVAYLTVALVLFMAAGLAVRSTG